MYFVVFVRLFTPEGLVHLRSLPASSRFDQLVEARVIEERSMTLMGPQMDAPVETVWLGGKLVALRLGRIIARSGAATVFGVQDRPDLVVKYQCNCQVLDGVHPLVREYLLLQEVAAIGVTPRVFFLSPSTKFSDEIVAKTQWTMDLATRKACANDPRSEVRFMVSERLSGSVRPSKPLRAVNVMIDAILALQKLHSLGLVHGDIHPGNVGFRSRNRNEQVVLLDLGFSHFVSDENPFRWPAWLRHNHAHCWWSHWNNQGHMLAFRDDVFRTLMVGAYMINSREWSKYCHSLESDLIAMVAWKEHANFFVIPDMEPRVSQDALGHLIKALSLARSVSNTHDRPPYAAIVAALRNARDSL